MRVRTLHHPQDLLARAEDALKVPAIIRHACAEGATPSGVKKRADMSPKLRSFAYPAWALAALKRDYPDIFEQLPEVRKIREGTASKGNASLDDKR